MSVHCFNYQIFHVLSEITHDGCDIDSEGESLLPERTLFSFLTLLTERENIWDLRMFHTVSAALETVRLWLPVTHIFKNYVQSEENVQTQVEVLNYCPELKGTSELIAQDKKKIKIFYNLGPVFFSVWLNLFISTKIFAELSCTEHGWNSWHPRQTANGTLEESVICKIKMFVFATAKFTFICLNAWCNVDHGVKNFVAIGLLMISCKLLAI